MYADDTVIFVGAKTQTTADAKRTDCLAKVVHWVDTSWLTLNAKKKTVAMCFSIRKLPVKTLLK